MFVGTVLDQFSIYFLSQKPLTWLEMVHVPEKISGFGCYKNGWTCPEVNVKSFVSVAKDAAGDDLTSCGNIRFCHRKHGWKCSALLKYMRRCHPLFGSKTTRDEHVASASWQWKSGMSNLSAC